ncbi:hypothetical protein [Candidatus Fukatsuia endosymbiont of Tuberolachnus salignus]|uniref:hypothetical protein n=1 Tax=Candidatus Fukatsuia endosymbiont of Tuberolachnus salignus TaxID=3077957 RepID=UPI00313D0E92
MTKNKKDNTAVTPPPSALIPMMHPSPLHPDDPITANVHPDEITRWLDEGWQHSEQEK